MVGLPRRARLLGARPGPVFASGTHGYDTADHFRVDPRLGHGADFDRLVKACRSRGVRLLLDGVFDHVGRGFGPFRAAERGDPEARRWFRWPVPQGGSDGAGGGGLGPSSEQHLGRRRGALRGHGCACRPLRGWGRAACSHPTGSMRKVAGMRSPGRRHRVPALADLQHHAAFSDVPWRDAVTIGDTVRPGEDRKQGADGRTRALTGQEKVDHAALFAAAPSAYAVVDPNLVVVEVNEAFCTLTARTREQLLGTKLVESFPDNPAAPAAQASTALLESLHRVLATARPDVMTPQRYDIADPVGGYVERYWSIVNVPVLDAQGRVALVLNRPAEITALVLDHGDAARERDPVAGAASEVFVLVRELQAALQAEATARARLSAVSEVALQLSRARTVADLVAVVIERGLAALGADGGAVAVRTGDHLDLTITSSLGEHTQTDYGRLPLDGPLPACVATATGTPVVLPDRQAALAFSPEMVRVMADTGCEAWVSLPLQPADTPIGALTIGWRGAREFPAAEMDVLQALAAQCGYGLERIGALQAEQRAAGQTRRMSETLQRSMLTAPFQPDHLELVVRYEPAAHDAFVGGDWYDAFMSRDGALCVAVGDVAGHDRDAAAAMGQLRNLLRGIAYALDEPPAGILDALDGAMRHLGVPAVATAVFGKVEQTAAHAPGQRTFRWSNAGHPPPLLLGPDGTTTLLPRHDRLLGTRADLPRTDHEQLLEPGSTLLLYTDGLVERRGADLDDGFAWLLDAVAGLAHGTLEELCDGLIAAVGDVADDVALLAVRAHPEDEPRPPEAGPQVLPPTV